MRRGVGPTVGRAAMAALVALALAAGLGASAAVGVGCHPPECSCPSVSGSIAVHAGCPSVVVREVEASGACAVDPADPRANVLLTGAGLCVVTVTSTAGTFHASATVSTSWEPCGSDPHGCGPYLAAAPADVTLSAACPALADAGSAEGAPEGEVEDAPGSPPPG